MLRTYYIQADFIRLDMVIDSSEDIDALEKFVKNIRLIIGDKW